MNVAPLDFVVLGTYLIGTALFGAWIGRKQTSANDYMLGGRSMPWWLVLASIVATETSTVTFLSIPGVSWASDLTWVQLPMGFLVGRLVILAVFLPRYFQGEVVTVYQILRERFGGAVQPVASVLFLGMRVIADGLRLGLSALVLEAMTGLSLITSIIVLGTVTILYTLIGGMRAVIWTDFVQFVVYTLGAVIAFVLLLRGIDGGFAAVLDTARENPTGIDKLRIFDFDFVLDRHKNFWAGIVGGTVLSIGSHGVDQLMVQRYLCAKNRRHASWALGLSGVVVLLQFGFFLVVGLALYTFFLQHPPQPPFGPNDGDRVFTKFLIENLPTGLLGVVLGSLFAVIMSTLSSSLNSAATVTVHDLLDRVRPAPSDRIRLRRARIATAVFGIALVLAAISVRNFERSTVDRVLGIAGLSTGLVLGLFALGMLTRRTGSTAALVGMGIATAVMVWIQGYTTVAWPWYALIGCIITFTAGLLASLLVERSPPGDLHRPRHPAR
ncbi:MAG: sodium:solute symporter [Planctomycetota bacterium]